ncbi:hypothetical protein EDD18DRAFT_1358340 [Armillaria luteobubalina]|uniref:Uncharacterized protein n=1 Tax=Armillaria luteobubalina TaxID=153913 RepID=A0AA39UT99_9AGAR|nr:hypothetical protein EDD18DRAFT_1358340 [Armillaria luteobubalina]
MSASETGLSYIYLILRHCQPTPYNDAWRLPDIRHYALAHAVTEPYKDDILHDIQLERAPESKISQSIKETRSRGGTGVCAGREGAGGWRESYS